MAPAWFPARFFSKKQLRKMVFPLSIATPPYVEPKLSKNQTFSKVAVPALKKEP